jgi:hypothetical protein
MVSIGLPPSALAHLIEGGTLILRGGEEDIELYAESYDLAGDVGEAILRVIPMLGAKQ